MSKISECPNCNRAGWGCICHVYEDEDCPICKDKGGPVGANGECLCCTAEAGELCK